MAQDVAQIHIHLPAVRTHFLAQHMPWCMHIVILVVFVEGECVEHRHAVPVAIAYAEQEAAQVLPRNVIDHRGRIVSAGMSKPQPVM